MIRAILSIASLALLSVQQPQITNGTVVPAASNSIEREIASAAARPEPSWVAWKVPAVNGRSRSCCWYSNNGESWYGCGLEPHEAGTTMTRPAQPSGPVPLEGGTMVLILARVGGMGPGGSAAGGNIRVRAFSDDCPLDAGGRAIHLVEGVTPEASVQWLAGLIAAEAKSEGDHARPGAALSAIAATAGPAADAALNRFAEASQPPKLRRQAIFWIGQSRGDAGFRALRAMLEREDDTRVRRNIIQAISRSKSADALPALLAIAKNDPDAAARGEALFWLAQTAGKDVAGEISEAAKHDPDAKVQERAVMALSQLPKDQGVPLLIDLARTHGNPRVRKRAMFWLGQSKDPRAVKFFEEILIGR